jgi:hypothetical protein
MQATKILWGQVLAVFLIVLTGIWSATQWTASALGYQPELGPPWFTLGAWPIYHPYDLFWWWFSFDAYAPHIFDTGGTIAVSGGLVSIVVAMGMSVWRAREIKNAETYGSARWANGPGPGERQVGTTGGSHGVAAIPICEATGQGPGGGPTKAPTHYPVTNFIAVATHPDLNDVWATWGQYQRIAAEAVVLDACEKTMGGGCRIVRSGYNITVVVGLDGAGKIVTSVGNNRKDAKNALTATCKSKGLACKVSQYFDAPQRNESISEASNKREQNDREGRYKNYFFPAGSVVPVPAAGTADIGVGLSDADGVRNTPKLPEVIGVRTLHTSPKGAWLLRVGDRNGQGCSLTYALGDQRVLFFGPTQGSKNGMLMISSKALPAVPATRETTVSITGDRGTANVRVFHMPTTAGGESYLVMPTDIVQTIGSISDKSPVKIVLEGKAILDMQIEGGLKARTEMQQCMMKR